MFEKYLVLKYQFHLFNYILYIVTHHVHLYHLLPTPTFSPFRVLTVMCSLFPVPTLRRRVGLTTIPKAVVPWLACITKI